MMPREKTYSSDLRGDLERINGALTVAVARYETREQAPAWLRMIQVVVDFHLTRLDRPAITYKPVARAVAAYQRNGGQ